jgi:TPR repeat protein
MQPLSQPENIPSEPPAYSTVMAADAGLTQTPLSTDATSTHHRSPSLDHAPYPPVDYGHPSNTHHTHESLGNINPNRLSGGSVQRRPISDPNDINFSQLSLTSNTSPPSAQRQQTAPPQAVSRHPYPAPRQRSVTGGYPDVDGSASVYSLDTGMSAYAPNGQYSQATYPGGGGAAGYGQPDFSNPYYSAANDFLGMPPQAAAAGYAGPSQPPSLMPQQSTASLARTNTTATSISALSSHSSVSLTRKPTEVVGASSTRRRAAIDVNKPPYTKQYVDDYRKRMKDDPDPEAQFAFAKYLIEAAKKLGDEISNTDVKLGRRYRDALLQESLRNIKKLAEGKEPYPDAQFFLANLYGTGQLGLQVDHEKAYWLYLMASKLNHPAATYRSAVCNEIGAGTKKDPNRAVLFYRKAAALGDTAAMYKLGMILLGGSLHQPRNPREAIVWLRRAASQADEDNPHALHELAMLHERPNNGVVPCDPNMARELYTQAAQLGYAPSQFKLGSCHEFGTLACPIDPRRSIGWYTRAAEKGDPEAELALSGWYLTGSGEWKDWRARQLLTDGLEGVLKQSDTEAYLWGRKAANKGLAKAEYAVGCER